MPQAAAMARPGVMLLLLAAAMASFCHAQGPAVQPPPPPQETPPGYAIQTDVSLVLLHVSVLKGDGEFVPGLKQEHFKVFEDKVEQKLSVFRQEDAAVSLGLLIDNSGSMRDKRAQVNAAALTFIKTSNQADEMFIVNFNDENIAGRIPNFTSDLNKLRASLESADSRGSTALYDATINSLGHLKKGAKDKKVLLIISDGLDNASRQPMESAVLEAQRSDAVIYAIGIFGSEMSGGDTRMARRALTELTTATGGLAFFPESAGEIEALCTQVAHDIRNQYTLGYYSTNAARDGTFRSVRVDVFPPSGTGRVSVRTRSGYYARRSPTPAD